MHSTAMDDLQGNFGDTAENQPEKIRGSIQA